MKLKEIADIANVSITTVSRVINKQGGVSDKNRKRIEKILLEKGFYKRSESSFKNNSLKKIAIILPDLKNPFFGEITKETSDKLRTFGYQSLIFNTNENYTLEKEAIESIVKLDDIAGVIICISCAINSSKNINILKEYNIPFVLIDRELEFHQDGIFMDDFKAGFLATEALIKKGHQKIGIVIGTTELINMKNRLEGYYYALKKYNLEKDKNLIFSADIALDSKCDNLKNILSNKFMFSALITANNALTINTLKILKSSKKSVELLGIGKFDYFDLLENHIEYIDWDVQKMSVAAVDLLIKKFEVSKDYTQKILFEPILTQKN